MLLMLKIKLGNKKSKGRIFVGVPKALASRAVGMNFFQNKETRSKIFLGSALMLIFIVLLGFVSISNISRIVDTSKKLDHSYIVLEEMDEIAIGGLEMEAGMRGFLLTGKEEFLEVYKHGQKTLKKYISELKVVVKNSPEQFNRVNETEDLFKK